MGVACSQFINLEEDAVINAPGNYPSFENPWEYKGWYIYKWTGWKGNWCKRNPLSPSETPICLNCKKAVELWDLVYISQNIDGVCHADCVPSYRGGIAGQWLAVDRIRIKGIYDPEERLAYSCAPEGVGFYGRGSCFYIGEPDILTYYTDIETLDRLRDEALERLKAFIDSDVNHA